MLGASVTVVLVVATGPTARRRLRVKSAEVLLTALAVVGVVLAVSVIPAAEEPERRDQVPGVPTPWPRRSTTGKIESAEDRASKWEVAFSYIRRAPDHRQRARSRVQFL
jgi:hypothetical protein